VRAAKTTAVLACLLLLAAGCTSAGAAGGGTHSAAPSARPCQLKVVGQGLTVTAKKDLRRGDGWWGLPIDTDEVWYGFEVKNTCDKVATDTTVSVDALDASGKPVLYTTTYKPLGYAPNVLPNVQPGQTVGYGGYFVNRPTSDGTTAPHYDVHAVKSVKVHLSNTAFRDVDQFDKWARPKVTNLSVSSHATNRLWTVSFTVSATGSGPLHNPAAFALFRSRSGSVVSSQGLDSEGFKLGRHTVRLAVPAGADPATTTVSVYEHPR